MLIELTSSELMALKTLVAAYMQMDRDTAGKVDVFIDCSVAPPVETTPEDLFRKLMMQDPI